MKELQDILKKEKYKKINFKVSKTQHLLIKATINGVSGNFILDTGASNSCVGFEGVDKFGLKSWEIKNQSFWCRSNRNVYTIGQKQFTTNWSLENCRFSFGYF